MRTNIMSTEKPAPRPTPTPPAIKGWQDVVKVLFSAIVWFAAVDANQAFKGQVDFTKLSGWDVNLPFGLSFHLPALTQTASGFSLGLYQGLILAAQAVILIWMGPTLIKYLQPALTAFARFPIKLIGDLRKAWSGKPLDDKDDTPLPPLTWKTALSVLSGVILWVATMLITRRIGNRKIGSRDERS